jgi:hypothetical protein
MQTVFPVVLAISEAVKPSLRGNEALLTHFVHEMNDITSWLITRQSHPNPTEAEVARKLDEVRDGLAHQLSLPNDVILADDMGKARRMAKSEPQKYVISTLDFIEVVRETVEKLIQSHPQVILDPRQTYWTQTKTPRGPGTIVPGTPQNLIARLFGHITGSSSGSGSGP